MRYFDHDTTASSDEKIMALRIEHGGAAVDAYWTLLELMYREETSLEIFANQRGTKLVSRSVSHLLCTGEETLKTWVSTMVELGLFQRDGDTIYSERALRNIEGYEKKRETARQNGKSGGRKPTQKPRRKKSETDVGSSVATDSKPTSAQEKKRKGFGFINQNQNPDSAAADAEKSASPESGEDDTVCPKCSDCGGMLFLSSKGVWTCKECGSTFPSLPLVSTGSIAWN